MLNRATITLKKDDADLTYHISSLLQGVLMELVPDGYGNILHRNEVKPYSQSVSIEGSHLIWTINTLDEESAVHLLDPLLSMQFDRVFLRQKQLELDIIQNERHQINYDILLRDTFFSRCNRYVTVRFKTPTAFKSKGKYQFYPTVRHIFQSLTSKFDCFSEESEIGFKENLEDIDNYVDIIKYSLHSTYFYLEGIKIPAFLGTVTFKINGPQQMVNLIHMLLRFGEYSGVGIKCAMGMGAICLVEKKERKKNE